MNFPQHLLILEFAQESNADELYAQIRDGYSNDETLTQIADKYENAEIEDQQFCDEVGEYLTKLGYSY